ncbi:MAG: tRNA (N6-isopentenyl adenosine(37)-C2)-methylthiotransferase MiaB [Clostridiales bacterium]|nr:tRNA (N6-isopentenyl adenosine(37)-C2)-methylthiotransferase MiaB [Clostridiales bacterium]
MKYFIQTFGCQMNENDSSQMDALLYGAGYSPVAAAEEADIIVVNTCCVRQSAENRAVGYIGSLKGLKEQNHGLMIAVCGCMMQKDGVTADFLRRHRHVGLLLGTFALSRLPEHIAAYRDRGEVIVDVEENYQEPENSQLPVLRAPKSYKEQVNIIYGCNNFCSYCIVPYVRGRERSRAPQQILEEIRTLAEAGVKEVQLLGQNVNAYGKDFVEVAWGFARLLRALDGIEGIERIRYMTSHPRDFTPELTETIAASRHICRHFHLPLQSGCDRILAAMNRGYDTNYYARLLENIRSLAPEATITSDLIVGFPGETEEDFRQTLKFVAACQLDAAYTFIYSQRSGTPAAMLPNQVAAEIKKERLQRLAAIQNPISLALNQRMIGAQQEIMVEGPSKNNPTRWSGRTEGNKITVFAYDEGNNLSPGDLVPVRITAAKTWNLSGELL